MYKKERVHHIDALRAYAILMMLQGHFIYSLIASKHQDATNFWYSTWMFCKGFTAPIFFTVTGLVLVFLLLKKADDSYQRERIEKGIKRGFYLLFWGYLLRFNIWGVFKGTLYPSFWMIDVLHCIGISLLLTCLLFRYLRHISYGLFGVLLFSIGAFIFLFEPWYGSYDFSFLPIAIGNYFTKVHGSVFTPFPWLGYTLIGGSLGVLYHYFINYKWQSVSLLAIPVVLAGLILTFFSSRILMNLHHLSGIGLFKSVAYNNFLFIRLGHILLFIALFMSLEPIFNRMQWFGKIGQRTLNIYIIHFILLYGSWFGLGLVRYWGNSLTPDKVIPGAILFVVSVTALAFIWEKIKAALKYQPFEQIWMPLFQVEWIPTRIRYWRMKINRFLETRRQ